MMKKFVYVFTENAKNRLLEKGYRLLKEDAANNIFVFANTEKMAFDLDGLIHLDMDTLSF